MAGSSIRSTWGYHTARFWVLLAAFTDCVLGTLLALVIIESLDWEPLLPVALAAWISGALCWWLVVERPAKPTILRGTLFGVVSVLLTFVVWLFGIGPIIYNALSESPVSLSRLALAYTDPTALWFVLAIFAFGSVVAVPVGTVGGIVLVLFRRRVPLRSESTSGDGRETR